MTAALIIIAFVLVLFLIAFAIHKKDSVTASLRLSWFGFSIEAKDTKVEGAARDKRS